MRAQTVTLGSATTSNAIPVDWRANPFNVQLVIDVISGINTSKVQYTVDNIFDSTVTPTWLDHATLTGITADAAGSLTIPVKAVRLNMTGWTSGTATLTVLQAPTA